MNWLWEFVWGLMPWWVWVGIGVAAAFAAYRLLGWKGVVSVAATTIGVVAYSRGAQKGVEVEKAKQDAADDKARDVIAEKKIEVKVLSPKERSERFGRWEKRP